MSTMQRLFRILTGVLMIGLSLLLILEPESGFLIVAGLLSVSLSVYGIRYLVYYFTMARHMVGGKLLLYVSIIALDLGVFTATLFDTPRIFIILYLLGAHAFSGVINIMRALEARRYGGAWRLNALQGAVGLLVALACVLFLRRTDVLVYVYSAGIIYSALMRIVTAFRRSAIVYIQ
ncbi:MAG: hypothetical protein J6W44_02075 [Oscillospiraceae bacterium]|nr:hypothetical protein [Oscillospiraceae bacterium]